MLVGATSSWLRHDRSDGTIWTWLEDYQRHHLKVAGEIKTEDGSLMTIYEAAAPASPAGGTAAH